MSKRIIYIIFVLLMGMFSCKQELNIAAEEEAIKSVNEKQLVAFKAFDYEGESAVWAHEPYIVYGPTDTMKIGWENLSAHYQENFKNWKRDQNFIVNQMTASNYDIRVNGNIAFATYDEFHEIVSNDEKTTSQSRSLKYFEKKNGQWKIIGVFPIP
jgi:ketosteroid isomerase-like protein